MLYTGAAQTERAMGLTWDEASVGDTTGARCIRTKPAGAAAQP
jgi:hypothetical protein